MGYEESGFDYVEKGLVTWMRPEDKISAVVMREKLAQRLLDLSEVVDGGLRHGGENWFFSINRDGDSIRAEMERVYEGVSVVWSMSLDCDKGFRVSEGSLVDGQVVNEFVEIRDGERLYQLFQSMPPVDLQWGEIDWGDMVVVSGENIEYQSVVAMAQYLLDRNDEYGKEPYFRNFYNEGWRVTNRLSFVSELDQACVILTREDVGENGDVREFEVGRIVREFKNRYDFESSDVIKICISDEFGRVTTYPLVMSSEMMLSLEEVIGMSLLLREMNMTMSLYETKD